LVTVQAMSAPSAFLLRAASQMAILQPLRSFFSLSMRASSALSTSCAMAGAARGIAKAVIKPVAKKVAHSGRNADVSIMVSAPPNKPQWTANAWRSGATLA
jgi:hypothetical protein